MKKKRHTVEQIIKILRQVDESFAIGLFCRDHNIAKMTFHRWRRKHGRMEMQDAKRLKELKKDNTELFKQFVDNQDFKWWLGDRVFELAYERSGESPLPTLGS